MKKYKKLRKQADDIVIEWLRTMVPEGEDRDRINITNIHEFLPEELYYYNAGVRTLNAMIPRKVYKQLKKGMTGKEILDGLA